MKNVSCLDSGNSVDIFYQTAHVTEAQLRPGFDSGQCGICVGLIGTGTGFSEYFCLLCLHHSILIHASIIDAM
jgi:hypothetical protein